MLATLTACTADDQSVPAAEPAPAPAPTEDVDSGPLTVDLDAIFPAGPGRDLLLNNCQTCHTWVPIVVLRMDEAAWYRNGLNHRGRVEALSDDDFETLYAYLSSTFTPERPVPALPDALLQSWTSN
jgi:mono/diheme cytochrome c family protein